MADGSDRLLDDINTPETAPVRDDIAAREENSDFDVGQALQREELERQKEDRAARREYAGKIFRLIVAWLVAIYAVILMQALCPAFKLSDTVLVTLISGTTINVLGLFIVVVNYLFSRTGAKTA